MRRTLVVLALASSFMTAPSGNFDRLWTLLSTFWGTSLSSTKEGCGADPDGRCLPASLPTKAGCELDPDGRCKTAPQLQLDAGCEMDPNGRCAPHS